MTFQRRLLTLVGVVVLGLASLGFAADARAADPPTYTINPTDTDPAILDTPGPVPGTRGDHLVWLAPEHRRVGKLLVFLPTGGQTNLPSEFTELGSVAGRLGYHTIALAYRNEAPVAALPTANPPGCGAAEMQPLNNACARQARVEILTGENASTVVNVDEANSIVNRLNKLLVHLKNNHPNDGWAQFLTSGPNPQPVWSETVIAGSSLGAGEALMIAQRHDVYRAALLHGWVDARYDWVKEPSATPSADYFTLIHQRDNFFGRTCYAYVALGLTPSCPLTGFSIAPAGSCTPTSAPLPTNPLWVEKLPSLAGLQMHVFNLDPGSYDLMGDYCHQSTSRNGWIAREPPELIAPSHKLVDAWSSVLGDETDGDGIRNLSDNCPATANAGQADADIDTLGDACDSDRDGDTVANATDNCPDTANGDQADTDGDGIGDVCDPTPQGTTPPTIAVPGHITVNATGPAGATVFFLVTATDDLPPAPSPVCTPSAGSLFAIGDTSVACTATDGGGNTASASFVVSVLGAKEQLAELIRKVIDSTNLPVAVRTHLIASLQSLLAGFDPTNALQRKVACLRLNVFTSIVRFLARPAQAAEWTADANRIRAVLAC